MKRKNQATNATTIPRRAELNQTLKLGRREGEREKGREEKGSKEENEGIHYTDIKKH